MSFTIRADSESQMVVPQEQQQQRQFSMASTIRTGVKFYEEQRRISSSQAPVEAATTGAHELTFPRAHARVAFVGNYLPRKCGIANFTHDLRCAVASRFMPEYPGLEVVVCCVNDAKDQYDYEPEVVFEFDQHERSAYARAADFLNNSADVDVVCVQHEFGIYGGSCGAHLIELLRALKVPVVTTLHTILKEPSVEQRRVLHSIIQYSAKVVTMTATGLSLLQSVYAAPMERIAVIPHGVPDRPFALPDGGVKARLGLGAASHVLLTFGLLSPNKGIEHMLRAMPSIAAEFPDVVYVVLGQTHPNLIRENGESYRFRLQHIVEELGISGNVVFVNKYADLDTLLEFISACDLYVTPYLHEAQITSGTLSYAYGMGRVVVSTPYWHARDLLGGSGNGRLVDFADWRGLSSAVLSLLRDPEELQRLSQWAYDDARASVWPRVAEAYASVFTEAMQGGAAAAKDRRARSKSFAGSVARDVTNVPPPHQLQHASPVPTLQISRCARASALARGAGSPRRSVKDASRDAIDEGPFADLSSQSISTFAPVPLPEVNLTHLLRLVDDTGIIQHATFAVPNRLYGYCTDDCARALSTLVRLKECEHELSRTAPVEAAVSTLLAFLLHAFDEQSGRFRNFMSYQRQWVDENGLGSEDAHGRAMQALGACVRFGVHVGLCTSLFRRGMAAVREFESPRAMAFSLQGVSHYREREACDRHAASLQKQLSARLAALYNECCSEVGDGFCWFERSLSYNNGALSAAVLYCGVQLGDSFLRKMGLDSLDWLCQQQIRQRDGAFTPVGSRTFEDGTHMRRVATFDQQPIEASDMVVACVAAFETTCDYSWLQRAASIFDWFLGRNHLGLPLYDAATGGCHDGLHRDRMNLNQGAESTICYLDALICLRKALPTRDDSQLTHTQTQKVEA